MRRPTRTRRLSIAAISSVVLFGVVAGAGVRSFWVWDIWDRPNAWEIDLVGGGANFLIHLHGPHKYTAPLEHLHMSIDPADSFTTRCLWDFEIHSKIENGGSGGQKLFQVSVPITFPLLLLLIIPVRWLIPRPENAPTFPVITRQP